MTSRNYQSIRTNYWEKARCRDEPLTADEIYIELFLITCNMCGPSGAFISNPSTIEYYTGIDSGGEASTDLWGNSKVQAILDSLVAKGRLKIYRGGWIWVIGKWEFESRNPSVQKALFIELESCPGQLVEDFLSKYSDTLSITIPDRVSDRVSSRVSNSPPDTKVDYINNILKESIPPTPLKTFKKEYNQLVDELFPKSEYTGWSEGQRLKQVDGLDKLIRLDKFPEEEVFSVLRWMRTDNFWNGTFQSIQRLRQNGQEKYLNARGQWRERYKQNGKQAVNYGFND